MAITRYDMHCPGPDELGYCAVESIESEDGQWMDACVVEMVIEDLEERILKLERRIWQLEKDR